MSIWSQIASSLVKGVGYTIGVKAGKDLYDAASKQVEKVDWEKLRDDAGGVAEKMSGVFGRGESAEEMRDASDPSDPSDPSDTDEEYLLDPDLIERTL